MKHMTLGKQGLISLAIIAGSGALADDNGWYVGGNIGQSDARIDNARISRGLLSNGFTTTAIRNDERDTGVKLFGGYRFHPNFAVEAGYFNLGEFTFIADTLPGGTLKGGIKLKGINVDVVGSLPINDKLSGFARAGFNFSRARASFAGSGAVNIPDPDRSERGTNPKIGLGLEYDFTPALGGRLEAERYRVDDAVGNKGDIDLISLGVVYRFGKNAPAGDTVSREPPPPVAKPPVIQTPVLVIVPVPPQTREYCSILDIRFEIDKDVIQREEKEKLAVLGTFMKKYPETTAVIEGHSDDIGTPEYNLQLSRHRAENVVSYLTGSEGIQPSRLSAVGYGDTRPVADNRSEEGKRQNRRIDAVIACATDIEGLAVQPARITLAMHMEFDRNRDEVKPEYTDGLVKVANFLKAHPTATASVEGHTGNLQGTQAEIMDISVRRARNVVKYLVEYLAVDPSRLTAEGFGNSRRFAYNTSLEGQQENRRVNIIINYAP